MTVFYRERDYASRRFYHTAVAANISSAVSAGVLLGLDRQALQVAMCLAAYQAAGPDNLTRDPGHLGKTFQVADTKYVKRIRIQSERLTKFWGRPMYLGALVVLPEGWDSHPRARYPLAIEAR